MLRLSKTSVFCVTTVRSQADPIVHGLRSEGFDASGTFAQEDQRKAQHN